MKLKIVCSLLGCLLLSGCGSVMGRTRLAQGETWYPGLKTDIAVVKGDSEYDYNFVQGTLWTLDMPLSLIGDTLMLPIDYFHGPWLLQTSSSSSSR